MTTINMIKFDRDYEEYTMVELNIVAPKVAKGAYVLELEKAVQHIQYRKLANEKADAVAKFEKLTSEDEYNVDEATELENKIALIQSGMDMIITNADYITGDELVRMHACFITKTLYKTFEDIRKMFLVHDKTVRKVYNALADSTEKQVTVDNDVQEQVTLIKKALVTYLDKVLEDGKFHTAFQMKFSNADIYDMLAALNGKKAYSGKRLNADAFGRTVPAIVLRRMKGN